MKVSTILSLFLSSFLVGTILLGSGCGGKEPTNGTPTPSPSPSPSPLPVDHLAIAKQAFKDKVWPSFKNDRCVVCHDFAVKGPLIASGGFTHPTGPLNDPTTCVGCHSTATVGFPNWRAAPAAQRWVTDDDPNRVRQLIIDTKGALLFKHLLGEGLNADPLVQWCFFNAPVDPPDTTLPGKVPGGGTHSPGFLPADLMDYTVFSPAVREWLCLEAKVPGSAPLVQPDDVIDCSAF